VCVGSGVGCLMRKLVRAWKLGSRACGELLLNCQVTADEPLDALTGLVAQGSRA